MNKQEKNIILELYKEALYSHHILRIEKVEVLREYRYLLSKLEITKDRYAIENDIIAERDNISSSKKDMYTMIFDTFSKYNRYVNFNIDDINMVFDDLQYEMTEEEISCHNARMRYILE
jgi:hypothetical protein